MNEWILFLNMVTADRHQWPKPAVPSAIAAIVADARAAKPAESLPEADRRHLHRAAWQIARQATGQLRLDPESRLYLPVTGDHRLNKEG